MLRKINRGRRNGKKNFSTLPSMDDLKVQQLFTKNYGLIVICAIFVIVGTGAILVSRAATPSVSAEAENGSMSSGASVGSDSTASGSSYARFSNGLTPTPPPPPPPTPTPGPVPGAKYPAQIIKLSNWYLTLPTGSSTADTIHQPQLNTYTSQYFFVNSTYDGVVFHAPVAGATTTSSSHTRSELRETSSSGTLPWGWSTGSGTHIMTATEAITHLPGGNGTLSFAQIHGPSSTWYLILDAVGTGSGTAKLVIKDDTGKATGAVINSNYTIGTKFNLTVSAINGTIGVDYNGVRKVTTSRSLADAYFKIGAYNQSSGDYGESVVYSLSVTHK